MRIREVFALLQVFVLLHFTVINHATAENPNEILIQSEVDQNHCVQLLSYQGTYRIRLFNDQDGTWHFDSETGPIRSVDIVPSLSMDNNMLYIRFTEREYFVFEQNKEGSWVLSFYYLSLPDKGDISLSIFDYGMFVVEEACDHVQTAYWLFGKTKFSTDLKSFDPSLISGSVHALSNIIDTSGWGTVCCVGENEISLHEYPDNNSRVLGYFFHGAPVRIIDQQANWVYVRIADYYGWIPKKSLRVDHEMLEAKILPIDHLHPHSVGLQEEAPIYRFPSVNADISFHLPNALELEICIVIGTIDEGWYMIWTPNDAEGFIQSCWIGDGNG